MYDSHAHLTQEPIINNIDSVLQDFKAKGGKGILNVSYDPQSIVKGIQLALEKQTSFAGIIYTALGVHPEYFSEIMDQENDLYKKYKVVINDLKSSYKENKKLLTAVGETGLDYYHFQHMHELTPDLQDQLEEIQRLSFKDHLELGLQYKLPLSIHCRDINGSTRVYEDTLKAIVEHGGGNTRGSFHSYTGPSEYVKDILNLGFYIGFNNIVTYPKAENVRKLISEVPNDRMLLETDSPLLVPQSIRNSKDKTVRRDYAQPSDVIEVAKIISEIKDISLDEVLKITSENFERLFLNA
ncbi:MAG TPA: TatD family hydrolase [Candidatus Dojkabacteria bacterium]|nr:TatD family hydrolase [Candidatus Dojkabacteria bacterium]